MADITMCRNAGCPMKNKCYRYTATPDMYRQSWFGGELKEGKCKYFWLDEKAKCYDVVDRETGEVYIDTGTGDDVINFIKKYQCQIINLTPDPETIHVIPEFYPE